jgi:hypothetical protein
VRTRLQLWQLAVLGVLLCAVAVGWGLWYFKSHTYNAERLLSALPAERATLLYLDAGALRKDGILELIAGSKTAEEPEYQAFVKQTGFDYRTDLDAVAASFEPGGVYFTVRGRFHWKQLNAYAESQGGRCRDSVCSMAGSVPERNISFYPLQSNVLAMAVAAQPEAVTTIGSAQNRGRDQVAPVSASGTVWMSVPPPVFKSRDAFPGGTGSFFSPLAHAAKVTFAAGPKGNGIELRLEVTCGTPEMAADLVHQLSNTTDLLKKTLRREHPQPNPRDLSEVLVAGSFEQKQTQVIGTWPIDRGFVETLANGQVQ